MSQTEWQMLQNLIAKLSEDEVEQVFAQLQKRLRSSTISANQPRLGAEPKGDDDSAKAQRQKKALDDMLAELEQYLDTNDGFSGRDHDQVLYGWNK